MTMFKNRIHRESIGLAFALSILTAGLSPAAYSESLEVPRFTHPLEIWDGVSATFGEYRGSRLHMGADFKTRGETGYGVLAADEGVIFRLKVQHRGYGRALYIRHPDGSVTVYGHLEQFENDTLGLEDLVRERIDKLGTYYPGDIFPDPPIPVSRGQVIGLSGESGMGFPHLHFEVREDGDVAVDPFTHGLTERQDTTPPALRSFRLYPAGPSSLVNGGRAPAEVGLNQKKGAYRASEIPVLTGPFRITVDGYDRFHADNWCGISHLRLEIDGTLAFETRFDRISYGVSRFGGLVYDTSNSHLGPSHYSYFLVPYKGNRVSEDENSSWSFDLARGYHQLTLVARDSFGNKTRAEMTVVADLPPIIDEVRMEESTGETVFFRVKVRDPDAFPEKDLGPERIELFAFDAASPRKQRLTSSRIERNQGWFECHVDRRELERNGLSSILGIRASDTLLNSNGVVVAWTDGSRTTPLDQLSVAGHRLDPGSESLELILQLAGAPPPELRAFVVDTSGRKEPLTVAFGPGFSPRIAIPVRSGASRDSEVLVQAPGMADYRVPLLGIAFGDDKGNVDVQFAGLRASARVGPGDPLHLEEATGLTLPAGLESAGPLVRLGPDGVPFTGRFNLFWTFPDGVKNGRKTGIFSWDPEVGVWWFEHSKIDHARRAATCRASKPGVYALAEDLAAPVISATVPADGSVVAADGLFLTADVTDVGLGLGAEGVRLVLDGKVLSTEYDPDRGRAKTREPFKISPGAHTLSVQARDEAGNEAAPVSSRFTARSDRTQKEE